MIDSNDTVFKYNKKANMYSMIEADYLMENNIFLHKSFGLTIQMAIFLLITNNAKKVLSEAQE